MDVFQHCNNQLNVNLAIIGSGLQEGAAMESQEPDPLHHPPATGAQASLCSPPLPLQPRPLCKVSSLPAAGGARLSKQSGPVRAGGDISGPPSLLVSSSSCPPTPLSWLCPSLPPDSLTLLSVFTCFHPASSNFTSTHSHLLGFPSCNLQLLSPPPPGLRDTKEFTHPHLHEETDQ